MVVKLLKTGAGFSTLEMLIAFTIIILTMASVVSLVFGSQEIVLDSQTNAEALFKAEAMLGQVRAEAGQDFNLVNSIATSTDGIYQKSIDVEQTDFYTKKVTSSISWQSNGRTQQVELTSLLTDFTNAGTGNTCDSNLSGDWLYPQASSSTLVSGDLLPSGVSNATYPITGIDAYLGKLYVAVSNTASATDPTFFIFDISDKTKKPIFDGSLDNSTTTVTGINAVRVAGNYAYVASARAIASTSPTFGQLQIIDVSNPAMPVIKSNFRIPGVGGSGGVGRSIFYKNGYVFLGLSSTAGNGPEFNIIDVHNFPTTTPSVIGSYAVGSGVESIIIKNNYAYLATDDHNKELTILDISNLSNPVLAGYFNAAGSGGNGNGDGESLSLVGDNLYLGRTYINNGPEFYITDVSSPSPATSTPALGFNNIGPNSANPFSVNSVVVRSNLAFLLAGSGSKGGSLQLFDISNPSALASSTPVAVVSLPNTNTGSGGTAMDCEGNYLYIGSSDGSGNSYITTVTAQ